MHRVLVRLPAVVALAVALAGYPALALATPPSATAAQQGTASDEESTTPAHAGAHLVADSEAEPQDAATAPAHDMEGMEGMDHSGSGSTSDEESAVGHTDTATSAATRPRVAVLSAFAGLNAAVLLTAAALRRRDREHPLHRPRRAATPTAS